MSGEIRRGVGIKRGRGSNGSFVGMECRNRGRVEWGRGQSGEGQKSSREREAGLSERER